MSKSLAGALFCLTSVASGAASAQELGTIRFDSWLSYQRNTDDSGRWQYDPRVFIPFRLSGGWTFTQRVDLPVLYTNQVGPANPTGAWKTGITDWYVEEIFGTPDLTENFKMWASVRLMFPTGGAAPFGSGQYQWSAAVSAIYAMPERGITFSPLVRNFQGFHITEPGVTTIRRLVIFPNVTFALPDNWSFALYPENPINYNLVTHQWFVPVDLMLVKRLVNGMELGIGAAVPLNNNNRLYNYNIYGRLTLYF
jgi:hypothetical protein